MTERRLALVTGGSGAIGGAVCRRLAAQGCDLVIGFHRNAAAATALQHELADVTRCESWQCDLADPAQLAAARDRFDDVAVFVHCAGIVIDAPMLRTSPDQWTHLMQLNAGSFHALAAAVLRGMIKRREGAIVAVGSVAGRTGIAGESAYSASKAALVGTVRSLAREVGRFNIRANLVEPGYIDTPMNHARDASQVLPDIPLGRLGRPAEVADVIAFLCSPQAGYVTGAVVAVSGGLDM